MKKKPVTDCRIRKDLGPKTLAWLRERVPHFADAETAVKKAADHARQVMKEATK